MDKNNSYLIISIILGFLITLFYIHNFDTIFLGNFILISFIIYVLFYYLGNKEVSENFINPGEEHLGEEHHGRLGSHGEEHHGEEHHGSKGEEHHGEEHHSEEHHGEEHHSEEHHGEEHHGEEHNYYDEEEEIKDKTFMEQMEEQEEHIREAQNMEEHQEELLHKMEEEEMHIQQKTPSQDNDGFMKKIMDNLNNLKTGINSGIGLGISPVNINLSCGGKSEDSNYAPMKPNRPAQKRCPDVNKQSSRIHNNSDWIYNNSYWKNQDDSYNYDDNTSGKLSPCSKGNNDDYLLPCIQPEANKIPQTLNNLLNKRNTNNESNVCPMEVNVPWSNYKTGDDKDNNKLLEGYNL
jgi:hypothetical protein